MKKLLLGALLLIAGIIIPASSNQARGKVITPDRFAGAWRLASLEEPDATGSIHKADCAGLLIFTPDGHISVQVMYRDPAPGNSAAPVQYAQGGYEASYGTYQINDNQTFTFHVEGALVRSLMGKDLPRAYEFSGKQLIVKSPDPKEHWRVAWERFDERSYK